MYVENGFDVLYVVSEKETLNSSTMVHTGSWQVSVDYLG